MIIGCEISIFMKNRHVDQSMETSKWKAVHAILEPIIDWSCVSLLYLIHHCEIIHDFDWVGCKLAISIFRALGCRPWKSRFVSDRTRWPYRLRVLLISNYDIIMKSNVNREGHLLALHWNHRFCRFLRFWQRPWNETFRCEWQPCHAIQHLIMQLSCREYDFIYNYGEITHHLDWFGFERTTCKFSCQSDTWPWKWRLCEIQSANPMDWECQWIAISI